MTTRKVVFTTYLVTRLEKGDYKDKKKQELVHNLDIKFQDLTKG